MRLYFCATFVLATAMLVGCDDKADSQIMSSQGDKGGNDGVSLLVGCYSVDKGVPAQIKLNETNGLFTMQMKEAVGGWDTPEPLDKLTQSQAWTYFGDNALGVAQSSIIDAVGRPDGVMAIGSLKSDITALNPRVDSPFLITIFGATNTVYNVPCDDEPFMYDNTVGGYVIFDGNPSTQ